MALFVLTIFCTLYTGALYIIAFHSIPLSGDQSVLGLILGQPKIILWGLSYSLALLAILLFHEMGHFLACARHRVRATWPFFIPAPPFTLSGTFGAFIKIQSPITSRRSLFDIGASGPIAGFVLALPVIAIGLALSKVTVRTAGAGAISLGEPLAFRLLAMLVHGNMAANQEVSLHPVAFAGWFGLLATALNLIPVGQLDGGHILYSLFGKKAFAAGVASVGILALLGVLFWPGWLVWALLVTLIGLRHPPVFEEERLDARRRLLAIALLLIFILSFTPTPIVLPD